VVYVSHVDQDHISGILRMADDALDWKIYQYQKDSGNSRVREPESIRPPEIKAIWHNSFHEQVGKNVGPIEDMMAAAAPALELRDEPWARNLAESMANLATSNREAALLSRRVGSRQLGIDLNPEFGGGLMFVPEPPDTIRIGGLDITVVGPFASDLAELRRDWNTWLESAKGKQQVAAIEGGAREDEARIGNAEIRALLDPLFGCPDNSGIAIP